MARPAGTDLAASLRRLRQAEGLTQNDLAVRSGVQLDTIRSIEQGKTTNPGVYTVLALADALGVTLDQLARPRDAGADRA